MEIDQQMILAVYFAKSCFPVAYLKSRQLIVNILSLADGSAHQNRQNRKATTSGDLEPFSMVIHLSIFVTKSMSLKFEKQVELQKREWEMVRQTCVIQTSETNQESNTEVESVSLHFCLHIALSVQLQL